MQKLALAFPNQPPRPGDPERAAIGVERWLEAAAKQSSGDESLPETSGSPGADTLLEYARTVANDPKGRALLEAVFGNSEYLGNALLRDLGFARSLFTSGPDASLDKSLADMRSELCAESDKDAAMRVLRRAKTRAALAVALADITGMWTLEQVTDALSDVAETALRLASRCLLRGAAQSGTLTIANSDAPEQGSGLIVLAMGKLGARELNFSSDIDLIVLFEPHRHMHAARQNGREIDYFDVQRSFVRLTRDLVAVMGERTRDGYVFRTDLRLRPDPGSTPLAVSVAAAETYYGSMGQNWERAAMIKARPVAGDLAAGEEFLGQIKSFVWRKHLDFASIQDVHAMKRQIDAHRGGGRIAVEGHNVKLGRGGIREIEFFAQTLQLIWGGRIPALRLRPTCEVLRTLAAEGLIEPETADSLIDSYHFLRRLEHRLQMVEDQQTHSLPDDAAGIERIAAFMGAADSDAFRRTLVGHLESVSGHYSQLFSRSPSLGAEGEMRGSLVFTGTENDPDTLDTLAGLGYSDPASLCNVVRGWHHGRIRATRSERARELLTALMPALLRQLAGTANPDAAFANFSKFLQNLPAGVQLFSLFQAKPELLRFVAEIMGSAPDLGERLSQHPSLLDGVLGGAFFAQPPDRAGLSHDLDIALQEARDYEDVLDIVRRFANDRKFQIGVQMLRGNATAAVTAPALSDLAEVVISGLLHRVTADFEAKHGRFAGTGAGLAVIALGKLGAREMTAKSDLDLVFVYDAGGQDQSDGAKPLPPSVYFARLGQRLISAITVLTPEGRLYDVDMRLRPSGNSGPLASSLAAFADYQRDQAWTWEHMALTRARAIAGPPELLARVEAVIAEILCAPRDPEKLLADVIEMRDRIDREKPARDPWDLKHRPGGIVDVEFIAQAMVLRHASAFPQVVSSNTAEALDRLRRAGVLDPEDAEALIAAAHLWLQLQSFMRTTLGIAVESDEVPAGLRTTMAKTTGVEDLAALESLVAETCGATAARFERLIGPLPGRAAAAD